MVINTEFVNIILLNYNSQNASCVVLGCHPKVQLPKNDNGSLVFIFDLPQHAFILYNCIPFIYFSWYKLDIAIALLLFSAVQLCPV